MGLFVRIVPTTGVIAVTADGATYNECGLTEIALFVGKTGPTTRQRGVIIQEKLRRIAHAIGRKPRAWPGAAATGTITVGTEVNDDKVTIDGTDIVVKAAAATEGQVTHGATPAATALNLVAKINAHSVIGPKIHAKINGTTPEQVDLTARLKGVAGNSLTLAETGTTFTISGANLTLGTARLGSAIVVPGLQGFTYAEKQTTDNVTESSIGLVWGQTAYLSVAKSRLFITSVEKLLSYYKRVYGRKA